MTDGSTPQSKRHHESLTETYIYEDPGAGLTACDENFARRAIKHHGLKVWKVDLSAETFVTLDDLEGNDG